MNLISCSDRYEGLQNPGHTFWYRGKTFGGAKTAPAFWKILVSKTPPRNLDAAAAPLLMMEIKTTSQKDLLLKSHKFILTVSRVLNLVLPIWMMMISWWIKDGIKIDLPSFSATQTMWRCPTQARLFARWTHYQCTVKIAKLKSFRSRDLGASKCQSAWCLVVRWGKKSFCPPPSLFLTPSFCHTLFHQ